MKTKARTRRDFIKKMYDLCKGADLSKTPQEPFAFFFDEYSFKEPSQRNFDAWFEKRNKKELEKAQKDMCGGGRSMLKISSDGKVKTIDPFTVH